MDGASDNTTRDSHQDGSSRPASQDELKRWIEQITGGAVTHWQPIPGGNRCLSWAVDVMPPSGGAVAELYLRYQPPRPPSAEPYTVWREARFYEALRGSNVPAPQLIAVHPSHEALLTQRVKGRAEYRRIKSEAQRKTVAQDFVRALATLHKLPVEETDAPGATAGMSIADCVRTELEIWRAMYLEAERQDPLIDFALDWLFANVPAPAQGPALVHGDAGPGNFLFDGGRMTALLDWELAHIGDPMEDLAWFSMRSVMEPVPDFTGLLRLYQEEMGWPIDLTRIRYHRVFVSTRVVIIRHRNITGQPGNSIVSGALNRRLLVTALAEANGVQLAWPAPIMALPTDRTALYEAVISDLRHEIADVSKDAGVVAAAKNAAKVLKYLKEFDRIGAGAEDANLQLLAELLGTPPANVTSGLGQVLETYRRGGLSFIAALQCFTSCVAHEAQIAAPSSGGLANRQFPALEQQMNEPSDGLDEPSREGPGQSND